jgi:gamma-glutamylcyclotransferase (GGCT)/AIG2-like uncharacterized protein YtfP
MFYFAYGSNMNPARVAQRGLRVGAISAATLHGVALEFNKQSRDHAGNGHANIVYAPGARVEGVLYGLTDAEQIARMDRYENAPINYSRERVIVRTEDGEQPAWTYFANRAVIVAGLKPTRAYLDHLLAGEAYLSAAYLAWLASVECADAGP